MSDEEENVPQKPKLSTYILYILVGLIIFSLIFVPFFSEEKNLKVNFLITQNVEENINCICKISFLNESFSENFALKKYESKFIKRNVIVPKDINFAIFFECFCEGNNKNEINNTKYHQTKMYIFEKSLNEIYGDIEFLTNDTKMSDTRITQE